MKTIIDLRSDTVSQPTPAMRKAIAHADVGDDVYGDDPTVNALEELVADILGKEEAAFMPTGTMTNQVALRTHTESGDEVLADIQAHIFTNEGGASGSLSGVSFHPLLGRHGIFTAEDVRLAIHIPNPRIPAKIGSPQKLMCLENTHNAGGGVIWPIESIKEVTGAARACGLKTHLDGARLWNASVASGILEADYAEPFDTVSVCFSKGLGAPVGSALAGNHELIARARRFKNMFGGGFRQAGLLAAGALYAIKNHRARLADDHQNARLFAAGLKELPGIELDMFRVQTNIVRFRYTFASSETFIEQCHGSGVAMKSSGHNGIRAVFHLDIAEAMVERALNVIRAVAEKQAV